MHKNRLPPFAAQFTHARSPRKASTKISIRSTPNARPPKHTSKARSISAGPLFPNHYDDGGFTGGNLDRPALQQLLEDIEAHRVDCVVVYKVDRLSRSLLDFARLVDRFDQRSVSFVSVTQQFNTTTSLGTVDAQHSLVVRSI